MIVTQDSNELGNCTFGDGATLVEMGRSLVTLRIVVMRVKFAIIHWLECILVEIMIQG